MTETDICNQSLGRIGAKQIVNLDTDTTAHSAQCRLHYDQTRDALLRSFEWPFASGHEELTKLYTLTVDSSPTPAAWAAGATLTGGSSGKTCMVKSKTSNTVYVVYDVSGTFTLGETISDGTNSIDCDATHPTFVEIVPDYEYDHQYQLPSDYLRLKEIYDDTDKFQITGDVIMSNSSDMQIKYVKQITDTTKFDPLFIEVFVLQLAIKLLPALGGVNTAPLKTDLMNELNLVTARCRTVAKQEANYSGKSSWNDARFSSSTYGWVEV
jgi:hypothetical protein